MGKSLFEESYKDEAGVSSGRKDDTTGKFWLRFDAIKEEESQDGLNYVKMYRTTVRVVEGEEQSVGDETTQATFRSKKHSFFEQDLKRVYMLIKGLSEGDVKKVPMLPILKALIKKNAAEGFVLEATCKVCMKKDGDEDDTYTRVRYNRLVPAAELKEALGKKGMKQFFPNGLPDSYEGLEGGEAADDEDESDDEDEKPVKKSKKPVDEDDDSDDEDEAPRKAKKKAKKPADEDDDSDDDE